MDLSPTTHVNTMERNSPEFEKSSVEISKGGFESFKIQKYSMEESPVGG
jgi:hypothetical protein